MATNKKYSNNVYRNDVGMAGVARMIEKHCKDMKPIPKAAHDAEFAALKEKAKLQTIKENKATPLSRRKGGKRVPDKEREERLKYFKDNFNGNNRSKVLDEMCRIFSIHKTSLQAWLGYSSEEYQASVQKRHVGR